MRCPHFVALLLGSVVTYVFLQFPIDSALGSTIQSVAGTVKRLISPTEFVYYTGTPHGNVPVMYSKSTVVPSGMSIRIGQDVTAFGTFNRFGQLVATRVTINSLYHIATWVYDDYMGKGRSVSAAGVNLLVSYAQDSAPDSSSKSVADCHSVALGCKAVFYFNPNHEIYGGSGCIYHPDADIVNAAAESWFVHDTGYTDSAHRVYGLTHSGCYVWEMNPNSTDFQTWSRNYLRSFANKYDLYFLDNDPMDVVDEGYFYGRGGCLPWPSYCYSTQEIPDDSTEVFAHANFVNAMSHTNGSQMYFFYQQASLNIPLDMSAVSSTIIGITCEGCVATAGSVRPNLYKPVLDEMAAVNASSSAYLLISKGVSPTGSATQILQRLVTTGIAWLAYSEGHTIVQPNLESHTPNLAVWPEDLIYPAFPVESMTTSSQDLQVSPGIYRREFAGCYYKATRIGPCAAIVNATPNAVVISRSWLHQTYHHIITVSGGDVLSGGIANMAGASFIPGLTTVEAGGSLLLAL